MRKAAKHALGDIGTNVPKSVQFTDTGAPAKVYAVYAVRASQNSQRYTPERAKAMKRYLLFNSGCGSCSGIAGQIEEETGGFLGLVDI